jgi:hypothetical protein
MGAYHNSSSGKYRREQREYREPRRRRRSASGRIRQRLRATYRQLVMLSEAFGRFADRID